MKSITHRRKDEIDVLWLLQEPGVVNRDTIAGYVRALFGRHAYLMLDDLEFLFLEADFRKKHDQ